MEISAISNRFNVATKSQYDTYPTNNMTTTYPAYIEEEEPKSKGNLGMLALAAIGIAGIAYGAYTHHKLSAADEVLTKTKAALEETKTKLTEAESKVSVAEKARDAANKALEDLKESTKKTSVFKKIKNWWNQKFPKKA
jgi:uncharacterized protein YPO0396